MHGITCHYRRRVEFFSSLLVPLCFRSSCQTGCHVSRTSEAGHETRSCLRRIRLPIIRPLDGLSPFPPIPAVGSAVCGEPAKFRETIMVAAVRVHKPGGPEVLTYEEIDVEAPGPGQIRINQHASGLNYIDTYIRSGMYPAATPFVAGNEGAGEVTAVGPGVTDFKVGDRVAYVVTLGGYSAERVLPADRAVKLPDGIPYEQAAGMMLKGMTVEYLVQRTFKVQKGHTILVHAAAGGVGLILGQWANHIGATVIGTVGSKEKAELARKNGYHHTIMYRDEDFVARIKE